jgi:5-methylcytosine-specific restriction protein A
MLGNSDVIAEVLLRANGTCEGCGQSAPFQRADGTLYLEVHHRRRLADAGEDSVENAIALCPNCHRERHYGINDTSDATK